LALKGDTTVELAREQVSPAEAADRNSKGLYSASAILLIVIAVLSFVVAYGGRVLYASGYPSTAEAYLQLVSQHQRLAATTWSLWIVMAFLSLPVLVAMYLILRRYNKNLALLGSLIALFYAIYDVGVTELNSLTLVSLGHEYAAATSAALQASLVAAASYGYYALPLQTVLSFAIGPVGYILWCVPMAKSFFGRGMAIFGVIVSVIGLLGSAAPVVPSSYFLGLCQFLCVRLIAIWSLILGLQLFGYARRIPSS
jgi:hypothetical protein